MNALFAALVTFFHYPLVQDALIGVGGAAVSDYDAFRKFHNWADVENFGWGVASFRWFQGAVVGVVSHLFGLGVGAATALFLIFPKQTLLTALTLSAVLFSGCIHDIGATTPQAQVADYGTRVLDSVHAVSQAIIDFNAQGVISEDATAKAMVIGNKVGVTGQQLSALLAAYDKGSADVRASLTKGINAKIAAIHDAVEDMLAAAPVPPALKDNGKTLLDTAQAVFDTLTSLKGLLPQPGV